MKKEFEIIIADLPDRECLVAELWYKEFMIAEISQENGDFQVQFFSSPNNQLTYNFEMVIEYLKKAKLRLIAELPSIN